MNNSHNYLFNKITDNSSVKKLAKSINILKNSEKFIHHDFGFLTSIQLLLMSNQSNSTKITQIMRKTITWCTNKHEILFHTQHLRQLMDNWRIKFSLNKHLEYWIVLQRLTKSIRVLGYILSKVLTSAVSCCGGKSVYI